MARTQVGQGTPHSQGHLDRSTEDNQGGIVLSRAVVTGPVRRGTAHRPHHDTIGDSLGKGYSQNSKMGDDEDSFGHEAIGTSPLFSDKSIPGGWGHDSALANATQESTPPRAHHVCHSQPLKVDGANVSQPVRSKADLMRGRMAMQCLLPRQAGLAYVPQALLL